MRVINIGGGEGADILHFIGTNQNEIPPFIANSNAVINYLQ